MHTLEDRILGIETCNNFLDGRSRQVTLNAFPKRKAYLPGGNKMNGYISIYGDGQFSSGSNQNCCANVQAEGCLQAFDLFSDRFSIQCPLPLHLWGWIRREVWRYYLLKASLRPEPQVDSTSVHSFTQGKRIFSSLKHGCTNIAAINT